MPGTTLYKAGTCYVPGCYATGILCLVHDMYQPCTRLVHAWYNLVQGWYMSLIHVMYQAVTRLVYAWCITCTSLVHVDQSCNSLVQGWYMSCTRHIPVVFQPCTRFVQALYKVVPALYKVVLYKADACSVPGCYTTGICLVHVMYQAVTRPVYAWCMTCTSLVQGCTRHAPALYKVVSDMF